jgi:hypothetical protein
MAHVPSLVQTEDKAFVRDTHSKALLSTDLAGLERSRSVRRKQQENEELKFEVAMLHERCRKLDENVAHMTKLMQIALEQLKPQ